MQHSYTQLPSPGAEGAQGLVGECTSEWVVLSRAHCKVKGKAVEVPNGLGSTLVDGLGHGGFHPDVQLVSAAGERVVGRHERDKFLIEGLAWRIPLHSSRELQRLSMSAFMYLRDSLVLTFAVEGTKRNTLTGF